MRRPLKLAFLSTMPPQRCGLASFTGDLMRAVEAAASGSACISVAMSAHPAAADPKALTISPQDPGAYDLAATRLNRAGIDLLCVQHEYGIYGGSDGELLLRLLDRLKAPVVATLHTVLDNPNRNQRRVMEAIADRADRLVAMTRQAASVMADVHGVSRSRLCVVPHGIPDAMPASRQAGRRLLRAEGREVLLTFGLLSPGKGIEHAIRALPAIVERRPNTVYVVLGATHPNLVRQEGEAYRHSLLALAENLGVAGHLQFVDRFVDLQELTDALAATDIYLTPYLNEAQSVSGTLAYSYGLGTAVVSTPYRHAAELLGDGRGVLVPFADPDAIAAATLALLDDPRRLHAMRAAARVAGREMVWPRIGSRYLDIFRQTATAATAFAG